MPSSVNTEKAPKTARRDFCPDLVFRRVGLPAIFPENKILLIAKKPSRSAFLRRARSGTVFLLKTVCFSVLEMFFGEGTKPTGIRQPKNAGMRTVVRTVRAGKNGEDSRLHFFVFFAEHCVISHGAGERGTFAPAIFKKNGACASLPGRFFPSLLWGRVKGMRLFFRVFWCDLHCFSVSRVALPAFHGSSGGDFGCFAFFRSGFGWFSLGFSRVSSQGREEVSPSVGSPRP